MEIAIVVGESDTIAPPVTNAERFARWVTGTTLMFLPVEIGHHTFLSESTPHGREVMPVLCVPGA